MKYVSVDYILQEIKQVKCEVAYTYDGLQRIKAKLRILYKLLSVAEELTPARDKTKENDIRKN